DVAGTDDSNCHAGSSSRLRTSSMCVVSLFQPRRRCSLVSEHAVGIGLGNIRREPWRGVFRVTYDLQDVPVFDGLSISVHLVNVDAGDSRVLRIVVEQIEEMDVCPDVVADGDDPMDLDSGECAFPRDLAK